MDKWHVINEGEHSEAMHHAIDEVLTEKMNKGEIRPTLRFWYRKNPSVPIGRFQAYSDEVEHDYAEEKDIEVVRRITGGGAMFCEPGNVITYSIYIPRGHVPEDVEESYQELDRFAVDTLNQLGVEAEYAPLNDIEHSEGKLGGAAQLRKDNAVLHHTTISYDLDIQKMLKVLRIGKEKVSDKAIKSAEQRVTRMSDLTDKDRSEIIDELIQNFTKGKEHEHRGLTDEEMDLAREKVREKFSTEDWNQGL
ncbi:lipoate--protein ligase family protein [Candidatus Nanohaloarchaea archaeon]|nr:lipoate--protein ligase family protein [Candidatus Nanohaloarchaea archaeon]